MRCLVPIVCLRTIDWSLTFRQSTLVAVLNYCFWLSPYERYLFDHYLCSTSSLENSQLTVNPSPKTMYLVVLLIKNLK